MATIPTTFKGSVDDSLTYSGWLADTLEHVPDLAYPLNIPVFAQMRKDPQISAVLAGYTLQIRRATWALDGSGCRPDVTRRLADDIGLPVAGEDTPGAARVRGVSFARHLRSALLSLPYGHIGAEMQAEIRDGKARLIALAERMPHTISEIHVDPRSGAFKGISQDVSPNTLSGRPQIPADRMVWYTHEHEGASWQGQSLIRPAYGPWLFKRELQVVLATSSRRFGMGVPTIQWDVDPTPPQHAAALAAVTAARVGDQAGMVLPRGARLVLAGMTGSAPDTLAFIKWLDGQISRMALMGHLDLGDTSNGSRALGESFIDVLMMAIQSVADDIADVFTRQVCARLVEWNEGVDEPVPRVTVSGIGSRRELTAESLDLLMRSGALSADPGLEAWVRREYRLPERQQAPQPPVVVPAPAPAPVVAGRPRGRQKRTPGQLALFAAGEEPEPDHATIQQQWANTKADLLADWPVTAQPMVDELAAQAETAAAVGDVAALGTLAVSAGVIAAVSLAFTGAATGLAVEAAANVVAEAASQGVSVLQPDLPGGDRVRQTADAVAHLVAAGYASGAAKAALQLAGVDPATVRDAVAAHLDGLSASVNGLVGDHVGALLSAAQHAGRLAVLEAAPASGYRAVEVNDTHQCKPCADIAGTLFPTLTEAVAAYPAAGHVSCLGGARCRGFIFPIYT